MKFDINKYVNNSWDEEKNPIRYHPDVEKKLVLPEKMP